MPTVSSHTEDVGVTSANFDTGTFRGVTSFLWELGMSEPDDWNAVVGKQQYSGMLRCGSDVSEFPGGGSAPLSSLMLVNQLEGMKRMMTLLAGQAETPNVDPPSSGLVIPRRDLSLSGLRIHDGHGRGIQQLETRPDRIDGNYDTDDVILDDVTAETVIPAGTWAVEMYVLAGASEDRQLLNGDVELRQIPLSGGMSGGGLLGVASELIGIDGMDGGTRRRVMRRFKFEAGQTYRVEAEVTGPDACNVVAGGAATCAAANDTLVAKVKVIGCDDADAIPNGLDADAFCEKGLPLDDADFECNETTGKCRECWAGLRSQQDCEGGGFCFEGMCDDATTCWSGAMPDRYESAAGGESSPTISASSPPMVRTLHRGDGDEEDVDTFFAVLPQYAASVPTSVYHLHLGVENLCASGGTGMVDGLEVRVQASSPLSPSGYSATLHTNLTDPEGDGWTQIDRELGLDVVIPASSSTGLNNGRPLRIQVRNVEPDFESIPYAVDIGIDSAPFHLPDLEVKVHPLEKMLQPMEIIEAEVEPGAVASMGPTNEAIEDDYTVFFKPAAGYEGAVLQGQVQLLLVTPDGQVPTNDNGTEIAQTVPQDGGLAIPLGALNPKLGPYEVRLATTAERVEGSVYLCSPNVDSCSTFDPRTSTCGSACTGDGYRCCADQDRNYTCANLKGSDVLNCGACGNACDWDEKCLKGVCVTGRATSCWNTTCPEDTECVSKDFLFLRNPQCKATLVDRTWCGWFGTACGSTQDCVLGLCLPKMNVACGLKCVGEGQTCCWVNGVEQCVDVASSWGRCGSCGNTCALDELCSGGKCEPWYTVAKVCPGEGGVNCSRTGISCKNVLNDPENCGECGFKCPDHAWCEDGECMSETKEGHDDD